MNLINKSDNPIESKYKNVKYLAISIKKQYEIYLIIHIKYFKNIIN